LPSIHRAFERARTRETSERRALHIAAWSNPELFANAKYRCAWTRNRVVNPRRSEVCVSRYVFVGASLTLCTGAEEAADVVPAPTARARVAARAPAVARRRAVEREFVTGGQDRPSSASM
jgi:hypothetical protein